MAFISSWNIISAAEIQSKGHTKTLIPPDEGCDYSNGILCRNCQFRECWEVIGRSRFLWENGLEMMGKVNEYGRIR